MLCYKFIYVYLFYIQICFASQQRNDRGITFFSASEVVWQSFYHKIYDKVCMTKLYDKVIWHFCVFSHTQLFDYVPYSKSILQNQLKYYFFCKGRLRVFILFYVLKVDFIVKSPTQYLNPLVPTVPKCHVSEKRMSHMGKENGPLGGVVGPGGGSGVEGRRKGKGVVTRHVKGKLVLSEIGRQLQSWHALAN